MPDGSRHRYGVSRALRRTAGAFVRIMPVIMGMLLLTSLVVTLLPPELVSSAFGHGPFIDTLFGVGLGSVAAGHPMVSYVLGGEMLEAGVTPYAVTALIVSWVTVGLVQLPAEALALGRRFALLRNASCVLLAVAVAVMTVEVLKLLEAL